MRQREGNMASDGRSDFSKGAMEDVLIETFGCFTLNNRIINLDSGRVRARTRTDGIKSADVMEDTLIETFGCFSFNKGIINLDSGRERKRDNVRIADTAVARSA
jgi:hypothetical protein